MTEGDIALHDVSYTLPSPAPTDKELEPEHPLSPASTHFEISSSTQDEGDGDDDGTNHGHRPSFSHLEPPECAGKPSFQSDLPPSPPLTRTPTEEKARGVSEHGGVASNGHTRGVTEEMDVEDNWHPLGGRVESSQPHAVSNDDSPISKTSRTNGKPGHLRLEFKPPSPQPWDLVDPPASNNDHMSSDYYATLSSNPKTFGSAQKKAREKQLIPRSAYYFGPPPVDSAYGTKPTGHIGVHHPREMFRIERDYSGGELPQFTAVYPLELEGRITPTQFLETINIINEILYSAHSISRAFIYNFFAIFTFQLSTLIMASHYDKEMRRLRSEIDRLNREVYNPSGLNILWPQKVAFLFLEIEYY